MENEVCHEQKSSSSLSQPHFVVTDFFSRQPQQPKSQVLDTPTVICSTASRRNSVDPGTEIYTFLCSIWYCQIWCWLETYTKHSSDTICWLLSYCTITYIWGTTFLMTFLHRKWENGHLLRSCTYNLQSLGLICKVHNRYKSSDKHMLKHFIKVGLLCIVYCRVQL